MSNEKKKRNRLSVESSLYLQQHAGNPVDWYPWGEEALAKAKKENKPLLISIGYSACHWCHVMEHESFTNEQVADFMNRHFVNIKIDREERPDLDQLYMEAVQLLHGHGGWPLNCFALPDGRPFWGATYFKKDQWLEVLDQIASLYRSEPQTLIDQAERISSGIGQMNLTIEHSEKEDLSGYDYRSLFTKLKSEFDNEYGGFSGAPKFPMPSVYRFLLHYHHLTGEQKALDHVLLTLKHMAAGGIYDQVGGGFARYSTDRYWKVPHFEKMLYDNAQLISLYSEAYMASGDNQLLETAIETLEFLEKEMGSAGKGFAAAIDADSSEGEGSYYTYTIEELQKLLGNDAGLMISYFKAGDEGMWEDGKNILMAHTNLHSFLQEHQLDMARFKEKLKKSRSILLEYRKQRPAPATDPKIITSWNAMMVTAYVNLYRASSKHGFLEKGAKLAGYITGSLINRDGALLHQYGDKRSLPAFLDDYGTLILALIALYSTTLDEQYAIRAKDLAQKVIDQFYDKNTGLFYFTGTQHEKAFAKRQEIHDNVIPSSNAMMMEALLALNQIFYDENHEVISKRAIHGMAENILRHPSAFSHWARLFLMHRFPFHTIVITGKNAGSFLGELTGSYLPQTITAGGFDESNLPVLKNRVQAGKNHIYICSNKECYPPLENTSEARKFLAELSNTEN